MQNNALFKLYVEKTPFHKYIKYKDIISKSGLLKEKEDYERGKR